ncbi:MAG: response regulator transcription factor [Clostridia bacterium]|jgi:DNA-binding NarL/FixJ family response regulator|nr:response regulator transcription factor [Clostridia bacterium]
MIKILIVDDQELIRQSLALILNNQPSMEVVGDAKSGTEAIEMTRRLRPEIILMDIRMPGMDGIQCMKIIKENLPHIKIIVLTTFDDDEYIYRALKGGADGFLLKGISTQELVKAITIVYNGGVSIEPDIANKVFQIFRKIASYDFANQVENQDIESLSNNELRIIQLIGQGLSNKQITHAMNFSEGTIRNYISSILRKLDLRDRTQIAIFAIQSSIMLRNIDHEKEG